MYMFKVSNKKINKYSHKNTSAECIAELNWSRSGVFIINFEQKS